MKLTKDSLLESYIIKKGANIHIVESSKEEAILFYEDIIDTLLAKGDYDKANKYKMDLLQKYGYEYKDKLTFATANPLLYYTSFEFISFNEYKSYCDLRYSTRVKKEGLLAHDTPVKNSDKRLEQNDFEVLSNLLSVTCEYTKKNYGTEEAYVVDNDTIYMKESSRYSSLAFVIIHELGHIYDNRYLKGNHEIAGDMAYASSSYGTINGGECFAENFMNFFTNPKFLRNGWEEVYSWLNKNISSTWKNAIQEILK